MLIALVAMCASAETYNYLKFTKTNGSTVTCSVEGIKVTYDNTNITVTNAEGTTTIALAEVQDMYFSNEAGGDDYLRGDVNGDKQVGAGDLVALINYLLDPNSPVNYANAAACNSLDSTTVDMDDLTALINYLLTNTWAD